MICCRRIAYASSRSVRGSVRNRGESGIIEGEGEAILRAEGIMARIWRNGRALRLGLAFICLGIALMALLAAISMLGAVRSLPAPERAVAPYNAVTSGRVSYAPRPSMPPTCATV